GKCGAAEFAQQGREVQGSVQSSLGHYLEVIVRGPGSRKAPDWCKSLLMTEHARNLSGLPSAVGWRVSAAPVAYPEALAFMETRAKAIAEGAAGELVWLLEHPPLYTAGTSAKPAD